MTLIPRIEQATAEHVRELMEEAWLEIHHDGYPPENERDTCRKCDRFARLLDAEAWTSAAELLVPEGYSEFRMMNVNGYAEATITNHDAKRTAWACHDNIIGLALAAACLRAKGLP